MIGKNSTRHVMIGFPRHHPGHLFRQNSSARDTIVTLLFESWKNWLAIAQHPDQRAQKRQHRDG
jgi:hypothetical protein